MKTCVMCGKELPTPLDEYGAFNEAKCWECFIEDSDRVDENYYNEFYKDLAAAFHELSLAIIEAKHTG